MADKKTRQPGNAAGDKGGNEMKAWHFLGEDCTLGYGDGRVVRTGETYTVPDDKPLILCKYGLHGSRRLIDALQYAPGPVLCRVDLIGKRIDGDDKSCAYVRRVEWMFDVTGVLREFARRCALDVIHLWDAPEVVVRYLRTGDESIRDAAREAAREAAWDLAWDATRAAARDAARAAARAAAWAAAWAAAGDAAWAAAKDKQNRRLTAIVMARQKIRKRGNNGDRAGTKGT